MPPQRSGRSTIIIAIFTANSSRVPPPFRKVAKALPIVEVPEPPPKPPIPPAHPIRLEQTFLRMKCIRRAVCEEFNIPEDALKSQRRTKEIVVPRHMVSYLASKLTKASLPSMARSFGQDHTTILHAIKRTAIRVRTNPVLRERAIRLEANLRQQFGETATPRNCIGRYVAHDRVEDHFRLGWMWAANLNEYAALMIWPCGCQCVEPKE